MIPFTIGIVIGAAVALSFRHPKPVYHRPAWMQRAEDAERWALSEPVRRKR